MAVVGTLLGAVVGVVGSYLVQRTSYRNESEERLGTTRREAYLDFLQGTHHMFVQINAAHHDFQRGNLNESDARERLRSVSAAEAQSSLEALRLVATDPVAAAAARLWAHMRRNASPLGDLHRPRYVEWRHGYWKRRRAILDAARSDTGFAPLDWDSAGVDPPRQPQ